MRMVLGVMIGIHAWLCLHLFKSGCVTERILKERRRALRWARTGLGVARSPPLAH